MIFLKNTNTFTNFKNKNFTFVPEKTRDKTLLKYRTASTSRLWEKRLDIEEKYGNQFNQNSPEWRSQLGPPGHNIPKTPRESFEEIILPFRSDPQLRDEYLSPFNHLRVGKILEDLDAMAGNVSYNHCDDYDSNTRTPNIVTASVDRILLKNKLKVGHDVKLQGQVTHVGNSSMEIKITALGRDPFNTDLIWQVWLESFFVMVSRDLEKACKVNPLKLETDLDKQHFHQGEENKKIRLEKKNKSLTRTYPTKEESELLHRLFLDKPPNLVPMNSTSKHTLILCQPSERNIHGKIFGGYLMRKGFEIAFSTAFLCAKEQPYFIALDDITFLQPVEIGSLLELDSTVVYIHKNYIQVEVFAKVLDPFGKEEPKLTNTFNFTFKLRGDGEKCDQGILPETYEEAMRYLQGKRILETRILDSYDNW